MDRAVELMERVGIPRAAERLRSYPHEFSGGMRQRVMIAMALSCSPKLLIADEPTTALDVTIQAQILDELRQLRDETGAGIILVTHDLGVVADIADRVVVMYSGRVVEQGTLDELFYDPQHPYTWGLLGSITRIDRDRSQRLPAIAGHAAVAAARRPTGCHFRPRCPHAFDKCTEVPELDRRGCPTRPGTVDRCWLELEQQARLRRGRRPDRARDAPRGRSDRRERRRVRAGRRAPRRSAQRRSRCSRSSTCKVLFPIKSGVIIDRTVGHVHAVDDVSFDARRGRDARRRRRVGLRQDDADPDAGAADRRRPAGAISFRGQDITKAKRKRDGSRSGARCRWSSRTRRRR